MPAFSASTLSTLHDRGSVDALSSSYAAVDTKNTHDALHVVCAWPLSGQYGPGSRFLYYVLIAACVFARKAEWLKNPCLAAALLFPAIAAIHGIVLAALHKDGAVDMDVFGAFQLCSIGILAAPVTVTLSRTYFQIRGRNTIFLWAGLILAGLLSLTIEFYRIDTTKCTHDDEGNPISSKASGFPYKKASCNLICREELGPHSPMRADSTSNIYVIPAPTSLTFGTATLLAVACCVHSLIWLASMSDKIMQSTRIRRFRDVDAEERINAPIAGTNGATEGKMRSVNDKVRFLLSIVAIPVFGGAGLAVLIIGERNFFSEQLMYQTEPIASIGQWGPIAGTGLAVIGSLYLLLVTDIEAVKFEGGSIHNCNCSHHHVSGDHISPVQSSIYVPRPSADVRSQPSIDGTAIDDSTPSDNGMQLAPTISRPYGDHHHGLTRNTTVNDGNRRRVAEAFIKFGNVLGTAARDLLDDSEFKRGRALDFPEVPGEIQRNPELTRIRSAYNPRRDSAGNPTSLPRSRSRSGSFLIDHSGNGLEDSPTPRRGASPRPSGSSFTSPTMPPRSYTGSVQMSRTISEPHRMRSDSGPPRATRMLSSTLEVPSRSHRGHRHTQSASSEMTMASTSRGIAQSPLGITTTIEDDVSSSSRTPSLVFPATPTSPDAGPSASR